MKFSKTFRNVSLLFVGLFFLSCEDLTEVNKNPNSAVSVSSNYILTHVLFTLGKSHYGLADVAQKISGTMQYSQVGTAFRSENVNHFGWTHDGGSWSIYFDVLRNIEIIRANAEADGNKMFEAIALILRSFSFGTATDLYGDIPYSEALLAKSGGYFPKYDEQRFIYKGILEDLKRASQLLENLETKDGVNATSDLLYKGDAVKWKKFANSLRLRYVMRLSEKKADMQAIGVNLDAEFANALPAIFTSNSDEAKIDFLGTNAENSTSGGPINSSNPNFAYKIGQSFIQRLLSLNDPRLHRWAEPVQYKWHPSASERKDTTFTNTFGESFKVTLLPSSGVSNVDTNAYVGLPAGIPTNDALNYNRGTYRENFPAERSPFISYTHSRYRKDKDPLIVMNLMTYADVKFILAEAAVRGLFGVSEAEKHYKEGIQASMTKWGVQSATSFDFNAYYDQPAVALEKATNKWERVMEQKYIASWLYPESWFDWRRTGYPKLSAGPAAFFGSDLPLRYIYPAPNLDPAYLKNYEDALTRLESTNRVPVGQSKDHHYSKTWLLQNTAKPW
jgi:hypothetical protein